MIETVVLDLDDTLFMTEAASFALENETARRCGYTPMCRETHQRNWGLPIDVAIAQRIPGIDVERFLSLFPTVLREFVETDRLDVLSEANIQALDRLIDAGYRLAVLTSRSLMELTHLQDPTHAIAPYVPAHAFHHRDNLAYLKPDPRAFDGVIAGGKPESFVYVGDSVTDCIAAKSAGLRFVACLESGLRSSAEFACLENPPDGYIKTFADLPDWLQSNR